MMPHHVVSRGGNAGRGTPKPRDGSQSTGQTRLSEAAYEDLDVLELLSRMRAGDRSAGAVFMTRYGSRIRRRIRGKLSPAMRRIFDSQDILSTLGRRLDQIVRSGSIEASTADGLWALVFRMARNAVVDKARAFQRLREIEGEDGAFARDRLHRLRRADRRRDEGEEIEVEAALELFDDRIDREILSLWLVGTRHKVIAEQVNLAPTAVRKRWQKIKSELQERFATKAGR